MSEESLNDNYEYEYHKKELTKQILRWLLDVRYWLGVLVGSTLERKDWNLNFSNLEYFWEPYQYLRIRIGVRTDHKSSYSKLPIDSINFPQGWYPFEYTFSHRDRDILIQQKLFTEIENLIEKHLHGIEPTNTWAVCNIRESGDCLGKGEYTTLCKLTHGKPICEKCEQYRERLNQLDVQGVVYLFGNKQYKFYKIGLSRNPNDRYKAVKTELPFPIEKVHQIPSDDIKKSEKLLHQLFGEKREHGEWFKLDETELNRFCSLRYFNKGKFYSSIEVSEFPNSFPVEFSNQVF